MEKKTITYKKKLKKTYTTGLVHSLVLPSCRVCSCLIQVFVVTAVDVGDRSALFPSVKYCLLCAGMKNSHCTASISAHDAFCSFIIESQANQPKRSTCFHLRVNKKTRPVARSEVAPSCLHPKRQTDALKGYMSHKGVHELLKVKRRRNTGVEKKKVNMYNLEKESVKTVTISQNGDRVNK